jgi:hypothetical protein
MKACNVELIARFLRFEKYQDVDNGAANVAGIIGTKQFAGETETTEDGISGSKNPLTPCVYAMGRITSG